MNEQYFSPSTRREHYLKAIEVLKDRLADGDIERYSLCILLGTIAYGHFFNSPWTGFTELNRYYPELTKPSTRLSQKKWELRVDATNERIDILEKANKIIDQTK